MVSSHLGQANTNQGFANSQILNQQQLGIFKSSGPVRATAFDYKMDQYHGIQFYILIYTDDRLIMFSCTFQHSMCVLVN